MQNQNKIYDSSRKSSSSNNKSKNSKADKLKLNSCKLGFRTNLAPIRKELNLLNNQNKKLDIFLYFRLELARLCLTTNSEFLNEKNNNNNNNNNLNKFNQKTFSVEFILNNKFYRLEFEINGIHRISESKTYKHIVDVYFNKGFNTFIFDPNENIKYNSHSPFFDLSENQILRNWIQQPILRLEFPEGDNAVNDKNNSFNPGVKTFLDFIAKYENFRKNNFNNYNLNNNNDAGIKKRNRGIPNIFRIEFIYYEKYMKEINDFNIKSILENYEKEILQKMSFLTIDKRFAVFLILSSNVLESPIDLDENFIDQMIAFSDSNNDNDSLFINNYKNKNNFENDDLFFSNLTPTDEMNLIYLNENQNKNFANKNSAKQSKNKTFDRFSEFFKWFDFSRKRYKFENNEKFFHFLYQKISNFDRKVESKKIKKIIITPNNFIFRYDWLNFTNRILDANKQYEENFLIVSFANQNLEKDFYSFIPKHKLVDYFGEILLKGIKIGNEIKFDFLCYSNSQLRSHSIWMIHENENFNMQKIFEKQGKFEHISNIASNASRRGLCLTSAKHYGKIGRENIEEIPDIVVNREEDNPLFLSALANNLIYNNNKNNNFNNNINNLSKNKTIIKTYNFTDGIGQISESLARKICEKLFNCGFATAFQIRLGGYKGVVAVHPDLKGDEIRLRNSMKKFESDSTDLYVIRISTFSPGFLNKQIIYLLSELGVSHKFFEKMLNEEIKKIENLLNSCFLNNECSDLRVSTEVYKIIQLFEEKFFNSQAEEDKINKNDVKNIKNKQEEEEEEEAEEKPFKDINRVFEKKEESDFKNNDKIIVKKKTKIEEINKTKEILLRTNPFFKGIHNTILFNKLIKLKDKCKLYDEFSGKFIGIIDELGILCENECFIQVTKPRARLPSTNYSAKVKLGAITITKNPCGYLEDIQVLYGVESKILEKFCFDVIVFPRKSKRPIQQLISGGDLDGDVYFVSWNSNLCPPDLVIGNRLIPSLDSIELIFKEEAKIIDETNFSKDILIDDGKKDNFIKIKDEDEIKEENYFGKIGKNQNLEILKNLNFYKNDNNNNNNNLINSNSDLKGNYDLKTALKISIENDSKIKFNRNTCANKQENDEILFKKVKENEHDFDLYGKSFFEKTNEKKENFIQKNYYNINESIFINNDNDNSIILPQKIDQESIFTNKTLIDLNHFENKNYNKRNLNDKYSLNKENLIDINFVSSKKEILNSAKEEISAFDYQMTLDCLLDEDEFRLEDLGKNDYRNSLSKFFCLYLKNDNLGIICNNLQAISDKLGPEAEETLILCIYQRKSVTFFKTGKTILIKDLKKIKSYPDFMERKNFNNYNKFNNKNNQYGYESQKTLGILYRKIKKKFDEEKKNLRDNDTAASIPSKYLKENLILFPGFEFFTKISWEFYYNYYSDLNSYLNKHMLEREFEFISSVRSPIFDIYQKKQIEDFDLNVNMQRDSEKFVQNYKKEFLLTILKVLNLLFSYEIKSDLFNKSYEDVLKTISENFWEKQINEVYLKSNFHCFEKRLFAIIAAKSRLLSNKGNLFDSNNNEENRADDYYSINSTDVEGLIENNLYEILEINEKNYDKLQLENFRKFYLNFKKGFLTSIYYDCYFCFFNNCQEVKRKILNCKLFELSDKFLNEKFAEVKKYEDINSNYQELNFDFYNPKNTNFFSMPWIIDSELLLDIKFS